MINFDEKTQEPPTDIGFATGAKHATYSNVRER